MDGFARLRAWLRNRQSAAGFSLIELLVVVGILGVLAAIATAAFGGFDANSTSTSCLADKTRLQRAESTYYLQKTRFGSENELIDAGLLGSASDLHDVTVASSAYTIAEVGRCVGTNTAYTIAAPTVGTAAKSGTTVAVMKADGTGVSGAVVSYSQSGWTTMGTTGSTGQVNAPLGDGAYDFRVVFGGTTNTLTNVNVTQGTLVTFPTVQLTVSLANSSGPLAGGSVSVQSSGGSSSSFGTTGATGSVSAEVLPAVYNVTMTYASRSMTQTNQSVSAPTTVAFSVHTLTVKLLSTSGSPLSGGSVSATPAGGSAFSLGATNASGLVTAAVLDGAYTISMTYNSSTSTQTPTLSGDTTITFQMSTVNLQMLSSTGSGLSGQDAAIWWRPTGTSTWTFAGYPNASGVVNASLLSGNYDFEARWFSIYEVKTAIAVTTDTTITWQALAATEYMRASTGTGLTGQDSAIWVRPNTTTTWTFSGYPNNAGQVTQQLLAGTYDFEARWFSIYEVKTAIAVTTDTTITWQALAATEYMRASTGTGLTGQDSAIWVRPNTTTTWTFSGYPNNAGQVTQQLLAGTYDFEARWFSIYEVKTAIAVTTDTTITWQALAATEYMRASTGTGLTGQDSAIWVRPNTTTTWTFSGYPNNAGQVTQQLLAGTYDFEARWFSIYEVKTAIAVTTDTTITWQALAATEYMRASTGTGLTGQDSAIWVRPNTTTTWTFSGYPNNAGQVTQQLLAGTYDFEARWFSIYEVKTAIAVTTDTTITWQALAATEYMRASTGTGLTGQDSAIWVRPNTTTTWTFSGYPNNAGQVTQQLLAGTYDFEARWFSIYEVKTAIAVTTDTTITWQALAATEYMRASTGTGLTGQDSAIWVRPNTTTTWTFSGYPNNAGQVTQQLLAGTYDFEFRWLGAYQVSSAQTVNGATTITADAAAVDVTARKTSDNSLVTGAATYVITSGGTFFVGYTDASGKYTAQVLTGTVSIQCTKSPLTGTNANLVVGSGGLSTTVMLA